jgi:hypothetical protein
MREWLNRNKIFFETICATLLSAMAVVVSIHSCQQTSLQLSRQELEKQPLLTWTGKDDDLVLQNEGTGIRNVIVDPKSVLIAEISFPGRSGKVSARRRLVWSELPYWPTGNATGIIVSLPIRYLSDDERRLESPFRKLGREIAPNANVDSFRQEMLARVSFLDIYDREQAQYFLLAPLLGNPRLNDVSGRRQFLEFEKLPAFDDSVEEHGLRAMWKEVLSKQPKSK